MAKSSFSVLLDDSVRDELVREAARRDLGIDALVEEAVVRLLDHEACKRDMIAEAVREADKGVFISEAAMRRWVLSWGTENELPPSEPDFFRRPL